jgi:gamma-glutamylputrescine oxidase
MPPDYPNTWYAQTAALPPPRPALAGTVEAEVCVIGGGLAGLNAALGLLERGRSVALLEARRIAWGASGRNGGFVGSGFSPGMPPIVARIGIDNARALHRLSQAAVDLIRHRMDVHAIACDAVTGPGVVKVWWTDDPGEAQEEIDYMGENFGLELEYWPRERLTAELRSGQYHDGWRNPRAFHFHPLKYALGIARIVESAGGRIFEDSPVPRIARRGARWEAIVGDGRVRAQTIVMAGGGYVSGVRWRIASAAQPVATYIMVTEPLGVRMKEAMADAYAVLDSRFDFDYYRPLPDTRLLWGGGITVRQRDPADLAQRMMRRLLKVYPQLAGIRSDFAWSGLMSYARHSMPQVGQLARGVWYAQGFGGHGMGTTTMAGEMLAAAIAQGDDRYRLLAPFSLAWAGGPIGRAAVQLTYWREQLKDWRKARRRAH